MTNETKKWIKALRLTPSEASKVASIEAEYAPDTATAGALRRQQVRATGWNLTLAAGHLTDEGRTTSYANDLEELRALIEDCS